MTCKGGYYCGRIAFEVQGDIAQARHRSGPSGCGRRGGVHRGSVGWPLARVDHGRGTGIATTGSLDYTRGQL